MLTKNTLQAQTSGGAAAYNLPTQEDLSGQRLLGKERLQMPRGFQAQSSGDNAEVDSMASQEDLSLGGSSSRLGKATKQLQDALGTEKIPDMQFESSGQVNLDPALQEYFDSLPFRTETEG